MIIKIYNNCNMDLSENVKEKGIVLIINNMMEDIEYVNFLNYINTLINELSKCCKNSCVDIYDENNKYIKTILYSLKNLDKWNKNILSSRKNDIATIYVSKFQTKQEYKQYYDKFYEICFLCKMKDNSEMRILFENSYIVNHDQKMKTYLKYYYKLTNDTNLVHEDKCCNTKLYRDFVKKC
jgi:hypothetical protein